MQAGPLEGTPHIQEAGSPEDAEKRRVAQAVLELSCLFVSVAKRNPGKGLLCEPQKVHPMGLDIYRSKVLDLAQCLRSTAGRV